MFMRTITPIMTIIITMIMTMTTITKANICAAASASAGMIIPKAE
jgi:hypothetical protein